MEPFERVVEEHGTVVLRVCRALVGPDAAHDAWSETFLAALVAYPRLRPGSDVRAWLVTIAHRKSVDVLRVRARQAVPVGDPPEPVSTGEHPGDGRSELWAAVAALPPKQRQCVAYHHVAGLPYDEVAALVGGTAAAARRAAADGMSTLRRTLREDQ
ncbi:RNA polymerase sigma factor (sigma-70 family) [Kineococcus rhizosphaerae]|uniref:RNA polymerase sigma factor (Sigma-70 family) n=1 Tax=Kineococcus rhizosphaerae TaxID=559628 RepID=A0A2T0QUY6_9ACTN|nr:RNA polymerase sigma factor (sigma-70 family) [Kineococcus rhizosphaerae]